MNTISERISEVVKKSALTKTAFAEKINVSQGFISQLCSGFSTPSDRTISDICREFGVDEVWLRTGEGEPFKRETREEAIMRFASQTIRGSDEFRKALVSTLAKLDADDWEALAGIFNKMLDTIETGE